MNHLEILGILGRVALTIVVGCGYWLAVRSLFPRFADRSYQRWRKSLWDVGVALLVIGAIAVILWMQWPQGDTSAWLKTGAKIILGPVIVLGIFGLTGLATHIGQGLKVPGEEHQSWKATLRGGVVLGLLTGLPIIGSWVVIPVLIVGGIGTVRMAWRGPAVSKGREPRRRDGIRSQPRGTAPEKDRDGGERKARPPRRGRNPRSRENRDKGDNPNPEVK